MSSDVVCLPTWALALLSASSLAYANLSTRENAALGSRRCNAAPFPRHTVLDDSITTIRRSAGQCRSEEAGAGANKGPSVGD